MSFLLHAVAPPLNTYINFLYAAQGPRPHGREAILPMPATDLKFNFGDPWRVHEPIQNSPVVVCGQSWCMGIWNRHHIVEWPAQPDFLGVSFKPGGAYAFLGVPISELHNSIVSLDTVWGRLATELRERLYCATTPERRFALAEEILLARLRDRPPACRAVDYAKRQIADRHGALKIGELCEEIGVSQKHLITLFKHVVGCTPKELARLHRFGHVLKSIDIESPVDWTSIAHENDYFDQSHFSRDFQAYTGLNPTTYLRLRRSARAEDQDNAVIVGVP